MTEIWVDDYQGTDRERLGLAYAAAFVSRPATVVLPARELRLASYLNVRPGVSIRGETGSSVLLDYPGSTSPSGSAPAGFRLMRTTTDPELQTALSGFAIRGRPEGYYKLIYALGASDVLVEGVDFGVCGQSFVELRNSTRMVIQDCTGPYGGDNSYDLGSSKYKIAVVGCTDVNVARVVLGTPEHDRNQSFVTINASHDVKVYDSMFYGTRTYCLNTHGTGSTGVVFERNQLHPGPNAKYGAVLVGNEYWGPDIDVVIRDNTMHGPGHFLELRAVSDANLNGNTIPACTELVRFGPGGGVARVSG